MTNWSYVFTKQVIADAQLDCVLGKVAVSEARRTINLIYRASGWTEESLDRADRQLLAERLRRERQ